MGKSERLRHSDLKNIYRLIGECRDLGADPLAWRRRLLEGVMQLTGARVGYLVAVGEVQPMPSRSWSILARVSSSSNRERWS